MLVQEDGDFHVWHVLIELYEHGHSISTNAVHSVTISKLQPAPAVATRMRNLVSMPCTAYACA